MLDSPLVDPEVPQSPIKPDDPVSVLLRVEKLLTDILDYVSSPHHILSGKVVAVTAGQIVKFDPGLVTFKSLLIIFGSGNAGTMYIGKSDVTPQTGAVFTKGMYIELKNVTPSSIGIYADTANDTFTWVGEV
jgi:hypothetical protein